MTYLLIGLGSALGGIARYGCSLAIGTAIGGVFPWGTILVNVSGSFLIGAALGALEPGSRWQVSSSLRDFVNQFFMIGVLGGYTTFSSFSLQTLEMLRQHRWLDAGSNVALSVGLCMLAVWAGFLLATQINR